MTNIERRDSGMLYISDDSVMEEQAVARRLCQKLNTMDRSDFKGLQAVVRELLGKSDNAWINPPFYCDYGKNIEAGRNLFINYNCTIIDVAKVVIGDYCQIAPNVSIYTAGHPVHPATRNTLYEYGIGITIGDNVWIGGNTVICPGVTIGSNTVIGAGSVVNRDIPAWCVAAGNPCRVIRRITEEDRYTYFRGIPVDEEAKAHMQRIWAEAGKLPVKVAAAVIRDRGRVFATARGYGEYRGKWEFPGGKVEAGETPKKALAREIFEELDTKISVGDFIGTIEYDYPTFHLSMDAFWCEVEEGGLTLREAEAARWLTADTIDSVDWLPADLLLIDEIRKGLGA